MRQYERFAECMRRILEEKGVTITELTRTLGYKSRNSIFRILNDQTSSDVEASFLNLLQEKNALNLSDAEIAKLEQSLEISRVGLNDYLNNQAIRSLVVDEPAQKTEITCVFYKADGGSEELSFEAVMKQLAEYDQVEFIVSGCCNVTMFSTVAQVFATSDCNVSMRHYIYAGQDVLVRNLVSVQPVMYKNWYKGYLIQPDLCDPETSALLHTSCMMINASGKQVYRLQMLMMNSERMLCSSLLDGRMLNMIETELAQNSGLCVPLKNEFGDLSNSGEDYLRYTEQYRKLENDCRIFSLKPDVPINYIHPDILLSPTLDGFSQEQVVDQEGMEQLIRGLYDVQMKRFSNFFEKKRVTHTVFSLKGMERFARTGKQSDHFFGLRPYNVAERKAILLQLREQAVNNPFFWVYFLKDRDMELQAELTLYEDRGLMFMQADTEYKLEGDHNEALVNHPALNEKFRNFFMKDLLVNHVMEYQDGIAELDRLIQQLG